MEFEGNMTITIRRHIVAQVLNMKGTERAIQDWVETQKASLGRCT